MNPTRFAVCALALLFSLAAGAEEKSPEEVLKAKGLTKVGSTYVLEADAKLPEWLRSMRTSQHKVEASMRKRDGIERELEAADRQVADWEDQNLELTRKLSKTSKDAIGNYNLLVDQINAVRRKLRDAPKAIAERQKDLKAVGDPSDEYVAIVLKLSDMMEGLAASYEKLSADDEVAAAIKASNGPGKAKLKLGPSEQFTQELPAIRKLRETVTSAAIKLEFEGGVPHVLVTVNGSVKVPMVVDSGAATVTLTPETAKQLGLKPGPGDRIVHLVSADGKVTDAHVMTLKSMKVGVFTVKDVECAVQPAGIKGSMDLLGGTFLRRFVYKMDLAAGELRMSQIAVKPDADSPPSKSASQPTAPPASSTVAKTPAAATQPAPPAQGPRIGSIFDDPPPAALKGTSAFSVPADARWLPVDFNVVEGKCYHIDARGRWTDSSGAACGPEGVCPKEWQSVLGPLPGLPKEHRAEWYLNQHPHSALIARVGEAKVGFYVGAEATFIAPASGQLALRMNDGDKASPARSGKLDVTVAETQPHWFDPHGAALILARIDAVDRLHVTPEGLYWEWGGQWGKVGEHDGHFPTVINGILWWPKWTDKTHTDLLREPELRLKGSLKLIRVDAKRGSVTLEQPTPDEAILEFKDNGLGSSQIGCEIRFTMP